jgi:hypothetical protein
MKEAIKIDPYSKSVEVVRLNEPTTIANPETMRSAQAYGVPHDDWLLFSDLVHEKRTDIRKPRTSCMNVQEITKNRKNKVIMYVRDDLPPRHSDERNSIPGFCLNFGSNPNVFWGGIGYIDIVSESSSISPPFPTSSTSLLDEIRRDPSR